jgi:hypothetical protein
MAPDLALEATAFLAQSKVFLLRQENSITRTVLLSMVF